MLDRSLFDPRRSFCEGEPQESLLTSDIPELVVGILTFFLFFILDNIHLELGSGLDSIGLDGVVNELCLHD